MTKEPNERADEIGRLHQRVTALEPQLAEVYSSHSWRMTAPIRAAYGGLCWFLRNARRAFILLGWLGTGQLGRAAYGLLPYYRRLVPSRIRAMVPQGLRRAVERRMLKESDRGRARAHTVSRESYPCS